MSGYRGRVWSKTWKGHEHVKAEIHKVAHEVAETDVVVRQKYASSVATGLICSGIRDIASVNDPDIIRASQAQNALFELQHKCVWEYNLDFDLVRNEWAPILDPNDKGVAI